MNGLSMPAGAGRPFRLPLLMAAAQLFALALLACTGGSWQVAAVLAILVVPHYFVSFRLQPSVVVEWLVRLALFAAVVAVTRTPGSDLSEASVDPHSVVVLGYAGAAEFALQCWRTRPAGAPPGTVLVFFSGITFMAATYTFDIGIICWSSPVYFVLCVLSWRSLRPAREPRGDGSTRGRRLIVGLQYGSALLLALLIGAAIYSGFWIYRDQLEHLGQDALNSKVAPESTGMSSQPQLGSTFGLQGSPRRVLRISGALDDPHLRGVAYSTYLNGGWGPPSDRRPLVPLPDTLGAAPSGATRLTADTLAPTAGLLFLPLLSTQVDLPKNELVDWAASETGPLQSRNATPSSYAFSLAQSGRSPGLFDSKTAPSYLQNEVVVPASIDRRVPGFAQKVAGNARSAQQKINAVVTELMKDHQYSLTTTAGPGDPASAFILSHQAAHCEYFASAAVIMLRCLKVPARYVIGYYAHETDSEGDTIVRQRDAHAWAEAYVPGAGWTTVDATPGGGRPDELFGAAPWWQHGIDWMDDQIDSFRTRLADIGTTALAAAGAVVVLVYFAGQWLWLGLRRKRQDAAGGYTTEADLLLLAQRFERILLRAGAACPDERPWSEHLSGGLPARLDTGLAEQFVSAYNQARFGSTKSSDLTAMLAALEQPAQNSAGDTEKTRR